MNDPGIGHNVPPDDEQAFMFELQSRHGQLLDRRSDLLSAAERAPETVADDDTAGRAADFIKQLTAHEKAANKARTDEKEAYLLRGRWVDGFFKTSAVAGIAEVKKAMTDRLTAYQRKVAEEERRAREEAERKAREEAEQAAREAAEKAKAIETEVELDAAVEAEAAAKEAAEKAREAEAARDAKPADLSRQRSISGTTASLHTSWQCTSFSRADLDLNALRPYLPEDAIAKAIRGYIRAGGRTLAGATIEQVSQTRVI